MIVIYIMVEWSVVAYLWQCFQKLYVVIEWRIQYVCLWKKHSSFKMLHYLLKKSWFQLLENRHFWMVKLLNAFMMRYMIMVTIEIFLCICERRYKVFENIVSPFAMLGASSLNVQELRFKFSEIMVHCDEHYLALWMHIYIYIYICFYEKYHHLFKWWLFSFVIKLLFKTVLKYQVYSRNTAEIIIDDVTTI